jgi:hypothetical protein
MKKIAVLLIFMLISGISFASDLHYLNVRQDSDGTYSMTKPRVSDSIAKVSQSSQDFYGSDDDFYGSDDDFYGTDDGDTFSGTDAARYLVYAAAVGAAIFVVSNPWLLALF